MTVGAIELARMIRLPQQPTPEQAAVIEAPPGTGVVVAGAGSGKTETMAGRVVWLVANGLAPPEGVLGLTFTRKAAQELAERVRRRLAAWRGMGDPDAATGEPVVLTYAAYAQRLVTEHALRLGAEPDARLLSAAACWQLASGVVSRWTGALPAKLTSPPFVTDALLALSGQLADHLLTTAAVREFSDRLLGELEALPAGKGTRKQWPGDSERLVEHLLARRELLPLVDAFAAAKLAAGGRDFADEMVLAARLATLPEVRSVERDRYGAVLLDEYQDTGHAQVAMLSALFAGHPVTAVGDPFQAIYGWRGASAGTMRSFLRTFDPAGRQIALATSWRNDQRVLVAANAVADGLRDAGEPALRPRPGAGAGTVRAVLTETAEQEAAWVAGNLRDAWDAAAQLTPGARTAAVLVRRRTLIPNLVAALQAAGLPVEIVDLGGLLQVPEIADIRATLQVLADHTSGAALMRLLTGARWRIGAPDLVALADRAAWLARAEGGTEPDPGALPDLGSDAARAGIVEALDDLGPAQRYSAEGHRRLRALSAELRMLRARVAVPLPELVADVERTLGLDVEVAARPDRSATGRVHLDRFLDEAARFAAESDRTGLPAFLSYLDVAEDEERGLEPGDISVETERVQVLTVHAAKGLEWDTVAVPGLVDSVFPSRPQGGVWATDRAAVPTPLRGDRDQLPDLVLTGADTRNEVGKRVRAFVERYGEHHRTEERRLAYVAVTRARHALLLSGAVWDDGKRPREPSPFLVELAAHAEVDGWFEPADGALNPNEALTDTAQWPVAPFGPRRADVEAGAQLVRAALAAGPAPPRPATQALLPTLLDDVAERASEWAREADALLAERAAEQRAGAIEVPLPGQLSVSQLVTLARDPDELARRLRRPLPAAPAPLARRGTAFHAWLERRFAADALLDLDELPGFADSGVVDETALVELIDAFERSEWAARQPAEVEVPFEMLVEGRVVRGRMDAVFAEPDGRFTVVDWKTGAQPAGRDAQAAAVQLAAYRLAWAELAGVPVGHVEAAFHYVAAGRTVRPPLPDDPAALRAMVSVSSLPAAGR